jgi:hypothetical protein
MLLSETDHLQVRKQKHRTVFTTIENCKIILIVIYMVFEISQKMLLRLFALKHM